MFMACKAVSSKDVWQEIFCRILHHQPLPLDVEGRERGRQREEGTGEQKMFHYSIFQSDISLLLFPGISLVLFNRQDERKGIDIDIQRQRRTVQRLKSDWCSFPGLFFFIASDQTDLHVKTRKGKKMVLKMRHERDKRYFVSLWSSVSTKNLSFDFLSLPFSFRLSCLWYHIQLNHWTCHEKRNREREMSRLGHNDKWYRSKRDKSLKQDKHEIPWQVRQDWFHNKYFVYDKFILSGEKRRKDRMKNEGKGMRDDEGIQDREEKEKGKKIKWMNEEERRESYQKRDIWRKEARSKEGMKRQNMKNIQETTESILYVKRVYNMDRKPNMGWWMDSGSWWIFSHLYLTLHLSISLSHFPCILLSLHRLCF